MHTLSFLSASPVLLLALSGCTERQAVRPEPVPMVVTQEITFRDPPRPYAPLTANTNDPEQIVRVALKLANRGAFARAATLFLDAANLPQTDSVDNAFRIAALGAAASCFVQAGDTAAFQQAVAQLRIALRRYQLATLPPELTVLLSLDAALRDAPSDLVDTLPPALRALFREEGK